MIYAVLLALVIGWVIGWYILPRVLDSLYDAIHRKKMPAPEKVGPYKFMQWCLACGWYPDDHGIRPRDVCPTCGNDLEIVRAAYVYRPSQGVFDRITGIKICDVQKQSDGAERVIEGAG